MTAGVGVAQHRSMRLRSGKELSVGASKRRRATKTRSRPCSISPRLKQLEGQERSSMATTAEYKSVLDLVRLALGFGCSIDEAVNEANAQFVSDTEDLRTLVVTRRISQLDALEAHGYRPSSAPFKPTLIPEYVTLGMDGQAARGQAQKQVELHEARRKAIAVAIEENDKREREERERERQHEETMGKLRNEEQQIEVQKIKRKAEQDARAMEHEEKKMEHQETMTKYQIHLAQANKRQHATFPTIASVDQNAFIYDVMQRSKVVQTVADMFDTIQACISDKLTRRSHATTVTLQAGVAQRQQQQRAMHFAGGEVRPLVVANKCVESVQYSMLQRFNDDLVGGHFEITDDSNAFVLGPEDKVDHVVMWRGDQQRATKSPLNASFVVEQKPTPKLTASDIIQLLRYMYHILHGTGPVYENADLECRRTHVIGILVYRAPLTERDPLPLEDNMTIPPVEVTNAQLKKPKDNQEGKEAPRRDRRAEYSRLVADVFVLFHSSIMPEPHLLQLAEKGVDAATLFAQLGSSNTTYTNIQHSFGMSSFTTETVDLVSYDCVRFLGTGAGATDVWECVRHNESREADEVDTAAFRGSTGSSEHDFPQQARSPVRYNAVVLKRTIPGGCNHEAFMLRNLKDRLAEALPKGAGVLFPDFISMNHEGSRLVSRPVCHKMMSGSEIRRAHLYPDAYRDEYLKMLGKYFVDYVDTLQKCHEVAGIVHRDVALRNLMVSLEPRSSTKRGCIIDWECAAELDPATKMYVQPDPNIRVSLETVTESYLNTLEYRPADDLVALVRCWKLATQLPSYSAFKEWGVFVEDHQQMRNVIRAYWRRQHGELDKLAEQTNYDALKAYFNDPTYIEPKQPLAAEELDDEELHPGNPLHRALSIAQYNHTLVDSQATESP